jgi:hypothetical protein
VIERDRDVRDGRLERISPRTAPTSWPSGAFADGAPKYALNSS